jgi:putative transposon-encoded protein
VQKADENTSIPCPKTKFKSYGEEMIEKQVKKSGRAGRLYLPLDWVGKSVKIIRID